MGEAQAAGRAGGRARKLRGMFRRLKRALDDALSRLEARAGPGTEEEVDRLIAAMREELIETKASIPGLEGQIRSLERQRDAEEKRAEECVRRAAQAEAIDDGETVEVAERFAREHLARVQVLEQKIEAAKSELVLRREEVARMTSQLKDARARRDALAIQARRARTMEKTRGAGTDALEEFERAAERISRPSEVEVAERELDRELGLGREATPADPEAERLYREARAEEMLRELKRRMGLEESGEG